MVFNSFVFWGFFLVVWALYWRLSHRNQNRLLLVASYVFYGCWDWRFLGLLMATTLWDFCIARTISRTTSRSLKRLVLMTSIVMNLSVLGFFKYYGFFSRELAELCQGVGLPQLLPYLNVVLPVGISFFTFQSMSYTIDVYKGRIRAADNLLDFALYISFFPQLVAGPIERGETLLGQVLQARPRRSEDFALGLYDIVLGIFLKVFIADNMAVLVNTVFHRPPETVTGTEVLAAVYAFAFQIYGDFAGYSLMARGVAKWLGFDLMLNFRRPYFAVNPSDFWKRWHISLSQWLRDYLYIPLGGNRGSRWMVYRNLMLTMLLGGLWHGANWTFIAWGAFHGLLLCGHRLLSATENRDATGDRFRVLKMIAMFHLVCVGWLLFRAESIGQAGVMLWQIVAHQQMTPLASTIFGMMAICVTPLVLYEIWEESRTETIPLLRWHWLPRGLAYSYVALMCILVPPPQAATFIYFQF